MAHKWKFTVNDDGSFTAEVVQKPVDLVKEQAAWNHLRDDIKCLRCLLEEAVQFVERSLPLSDDWLEDAKEALR